MKSRYAEEKYDEAADIADTINWNKVKNVKAFLTLFSFTFFLCYNAW